MDKAAYRIQFQAYRDGLNEEEYASKSGVICAKISELDVFKDAQHVFLFAPLLVRREVNIRSLIERLWQNRKSVYMPVITDLKKGEMQAFRLDSWDEAIYSIWDIAEPPRSYPLDVRELDLVIAPALGADRRGFRLGYGKGFYDRFLKPLSAPIVVPMFAANLIEQLPIDAHDIAANFVISENETLIIS
jgi:5-formyltetrahydrofolate cyclo-ligase